MKTKKRFSPYIIARRIFAGMVGVSAVVATVSVWQLRILPVMYVSIASIIGALTVGLLIKALWSKQERKLWVNTLLVLAALGVMFASFFTTMAARSTSSILSSATSLSTANTNTNIKKPYVIYISGIDTYGDIATTSRSDVNILAVVNPADKKVLLVTTPRDYYVQLNGTTGVKDKLTHAGIYGVDKSKATLEDLYGTKVDYTVRINFSSLLKLVDAVGGITVTSDQAFSADGYNFVAGPNNLDAKQALAFARERYSFSEGDRQRGKNQQRVIEALISKLSQPQMALKLPAILSATNGAFQTNASRNEINAIIQQQLSGAGSWTTESISVDGTGTSAPTYSMGSQLLYVMIPNYATVEAAKAKISAYLQN
jgi:LCP family protein required for cell wall assembly